MQKGPAFLRDLRGGTFAPESCRSELPISVVDDLEHPSGANIHQQEIIAVADPPLPAAWRPQVIRSVVANVVPRTVKRRLQSMTDCHRSVAPVPVGRHVSAVPANV